MQKVPYHFVALVLLIRKQRKKATQKAWREANPDITKAHRENNKEKLKAYFKAYAADNKEIINAKHRAYYAANKEILSIRKKEYRKANPEKFVNRSKNYYKNNTVECLARTKNYRINNQSRYLILNRRRRAKINKSVGHTTLEETLDILKNQQYRCVYCGTDITYRHHADHIMPISKGGTSWKDNIQMLCPYCNCSKHNKLPWMYEEAIGFIRAAEFFNNPKLYNEDCLITYPLT